MQASFEPVPIFPLPCRHHRRFRRMPASAQHIARPAAVSRAQNLRAGRVDGRRISWRPRRTGKSRTVPAAVEEDRVMRQTVSARGVLADGQADKWRCRRCRTGLSAAWRCAARGGATASCRNSPSFCLCHETARHRAGSLHSSEKSAPPERGKERCI